jgi:hypothetical protein
MAEFLQQQTREAVSPVTPGGATSPGTPGGDKISRTEAKKIFTNKVNELVEAVKLLPVYSDAVASLPKGKKFSVVFTDENGIRQDYQIGRQDVGKFRSQITKEMKDLPRLAFTLNKTRRSTAPYSGFLAPARFASPIIEFFSQANLGPQVQGQPLLRTDKGQNKKDVPDSKSLQVQPNTDLKNLLYFIQGDEQSNPMYGIISPGTLTPLFALHAYYTGMQYPGAATRLSASDTMRQILGGVMADTIRNDIRTYINNNPEQRNRAEQLQEQLLQAIDNPNLLTQDKSTTLPDRTAKKGVTEIFNPNHFLYAHFSKLISNSKITNEDPAQGPTKLSDDELNQLRPRIQQTYSGVPELQQEFNAFPDSYQQMVASGERPGLQQGENLPFEQLVLSNQQFNVALSRAHKNQEQLKAARVRKRNEQQQQQQMGAQQMGGPSAVQGLPGAQRGGMQMGQVQGLPGGQTFGGVPQVGQQ